MSDYGQWDICEKCQRHSDACHCLQGENLVNIDRVLEEIEKEFPTKNKKKSKENNNDR